MNQVRRLAKLGLLLVLGVQLAGCIIVPLHGWGHEYGHGDYGDRR